MKYLMIFRRFARNISSLSFGKLVEENGVGRCERHSVVTEDGYVLSVDRLATGPSLEEDARSRSLFSGIPVLLQHGLWSSSEDWILPGPSRSIGYLLSEAGFDVWFGNSRGNRYSRSHMKYSPCEDSKQYWNFSWHEMGCYDLPSTIDHILSTTGQSYLYYIGHSQGTTSFFAFASERPAYRSKVRAMIALAPVAYLRHMRNPNLLSLAAYERRLYSLLSRIGYYKLMPGEKLLSFMDKVWSKDFDKHSAEILKNLSYYATPDVKKNLKNILMSHVSCGCSYKQLAHFAQCCRAGQKFRKFDYGPWMNLQVYGSSEAPEYDLKSISIPIVLFHSDDDWLTHPKDVKSLIEDLPCETTLQVKVRQPKYNHLDFLWADFKEHGLYDKLLNYVRNFEMGKPSLKRATRDSI